MGYQPQVRSGLEMGYLYATAIGWGAGAGIWIDAEAYHGKRVDVGISLIAPLILGAAAPIGVFLADRRPMREGLPSAIASGLVIGAGEGLVIAAFGSSRGSNHATDNGWDFRTLTRAEIVGATLGGAGGIAWGLLAKPTPKRNMFLTSSVAWGAVIGYEFGGGATKTGTNWATSNDGVTLGGLVGFNIGLAAAAGVSAFWTPSWNQLAWMWGGFGIAEAVSAVVYPIYAATDKAAMRHGLIFQGVAGTVGVIGGAFIGRADRSGQVAREEREDREWMQHFHVARIRGGSLMPVQGGAGGTLMGELW
jgi:hypothetical protein